MLFIRKDNCFFSKCWRSQFLSLAAGPRCVSAPSDDVLCMLLQLLGKIILSANLPYCSIHDTSVFKYVSLALWSCLYMWVTLAHNGSPVEGARVEAAWLCSINSYIFWRGTTTLDFRGIKWRKNTSLLGFAWILSCFDETQPVAVSAVLQLGAGSHFSCQFLWA